MPIPKQTQEQRLVRRFVERRADKCGEHMCADLSACGCFAWARERKQYPVWVGDETEEGDDL